MRPAYRLASSKQLRTHLALPRPISARTALSGLLQHSALYSSLLQHHLSHDAPRLGPETTSKLRCRLLGLVLFVSTVRGAVLCKRLSPIGRGTAQPHSKAMPLRRPPFLTLAEPLAYAVYRSLVNTQAGYATRGAPAYLCIAIVPRTVDAPQTAEIGYNEFLQSGAQPSPDDWQRPNLVFRTPLGHDEMYRQWGLAFGEHVCTIAPRVRLLEQQVQQAQAAQQQAQAAQRHAEEARRQAENDLADERSRRVQDRKSCAYCQGRGKTCSSRHGTQGPHDNTCSWGSCPICHGTGWV